MLPYTVRVLVKKLWHKRFTQGMASPHFQATLKGPSPLRNHGWIVQTDKGLIQHARSVVTCRKQREQDRENNTETKTKHKRKNHKNQTNRNHTTCVSLSVNIVVPKKVTQLLRMSAASQQCWTNCFLLGIVSVSPVSPVSPAAKGSCVVAVFCSCGLFATGEPHNFSSKPPS